MYVKMYKEVTMESNEYLNFAKEMCSEAGKIMKKYFYQDSGISYKGDRTIVTLADKEINHILIEKVKEKWETIVFIQQ